MAENKENGHSEKSTVKKRYQPPAILERKQSSGDLQSRLKTRKVLGVGENSEDGSVPLSKIDQILGNDGHNMRQLPKGLWQWLLGNGCVSIIFATVTYVFPSIAINCWLGQSRSESSQPESCQASRLLIGLYCAALLSHGAMTCTVSLHLASKAVCRLVLLIQMAYKLIEILVLIPALLSAEGGGLGLGNWVCNLSWMIRTLEFAGGCYFYSKLVNYKMVPYYNRNRPTDTSSPLGLTSKDITE